MEEEKDRVIAQAQVRGLHLGCQEASRCPLDVLDKQTHFFSQRPYWHSLRQYQCARTDEPFESLFTGSVHPEVLSVSLLGGQVPIVKNPELQLWWFLYLSEVWGHLPIVSQVLQTPKTPSPLKKKKKIAHGNLIFFRGKTAAEAAADIINNHLPKLKELGRNGQIHVDNIDVFCEKGVFDLDSTRRILQAGKDIGLQINFHGDELHPMKAAEVRLTVAFPLSTLMLWKTYLVCSKTGVACWKDGEWGNLFEQCKDWCGEPWNPWPLLEMQFFAGHLHFCQLPIC